MTDLQIEFYTSIYEKKVQDLIFEIQITEFQIDIDLKRQPDLCDISNFYQKKLGNFWIAKFENQVVGTISLLDIGNQQTALRKMFVAKDFRGKALGVGQKLLDTLTEYAKNMGVADIYLGTTEKFIAAQRFYEKNNFVEIDKNTLPNSFPIMSVDVKFYQLKF